MLQVSRVQLSSPFRETAGAVVVFADFYKSESSNILFEICKLLLTESNGGMQNVTSLADLFPVCQAQLCCKVLLSISCSI